MTVEGANETLLRALRQREQVETQALAECDPDTSEALLDDTLFRTAPRPGRDGAVRPAADGGR